MNLINIRCILHKCCTNSSFIYFQADFIFRAVLGFIAKLNRKYSNFSCIPWPHTGTVCPIINILHLSGAFVTFDEPVLSLSPRVCS